MGPASGRRGEPFSSIQKRSEAFNSFIGDDFIVPKLKGESEASDDVQADNVSKEALNVIGLHGSGDKSLSSYKIGRWQR